MKPDRTSDDGSEVVESADLRHSEDRLVIPVKQLFRRPLRSPIELGRIDERAQ
jgi:hypothetical protein